MRRTGITIAIASVLVVVGALWSYRELWTDAVDDSERVRKAVMSPTPNLSSRYDPSPAIQDESEMADRDDPAKIRMAIEAGNVQIDFWGKVVDQDGLPLSGVQIAYAYSIHHGNDQGVAWIEYEKRKGRTVSDGEGSFTITGLRGHDLTIDSLTRQGYLRRDRLQLAYNFGGNNPATRFTPQRESPVRITMVQATATEPLIHVKGGLRVSGDGTVGRWNLWSGEPDSNGELAVSLRREPAVVEDPGQLVEWSADLQVIGGEIVEAPWEEEVHRAPESGYSASVPYPQKPRKEGAGCCSFYLRTADGRYGRIQVELYPDDDGPTARCFITGDMNPRPGSRNLEPSEEE